MCYVVRCLFELTLKRNDDMFKRITKFAKIFIVFHIVFFAFSVVGNVAKEQYLFYRPISMNDIVDLAYKNREDLEAFCYVIRANRYCEKAALGGFLPQINLFAVSGTSSLGPLTSGAGARAAAGGGFGQGVFPSESINLEISQLIFSYDGPMFQYKVAKEETNIAKAQREGLKNAIRFNAEAKFLELKKTLLKDDFVEALKESSDMTFDQSKARNEVGFLNNVQWDTANAVYSQELVDVGNYPNDIQQDVARLEREADTEISAESISLDYKDIDKIKLEPIDYYYQKALIYRPELEEQQHKIKQAKYSEKLYKHRYVPKLYFFSRTIKAVYSERNKPLTWQLGLRATWYFDGLTSYNTGRKFENFSTAFTLQKRDLEIKIVKDVKQVYYQLKNVLAQSEATEKRYKQAKANLGLKENELEIGLTPLFEYKQAEREYKNADFALKTIKIDIRNLYQRLLFICGYPC